MDQERFDKLTQALGKNKGESRRRLLAGAVAMVAAGVGLGFAAEDGEAVGRICRMPGQQCGRNRQCCSHRCKSGVCDCSPRGANCFRVGITCCSQRCRRGKCR
ncbi:MAG: hypothetical protein IT337_01415 [Thermomicrobiales bacterium]|nr:hypothetical protein [Thermomicrobiales bacterium]